MTEIINYIKSFLTYGDTAAAAAIGYTTDQAVWKNYKVVIPPNGHLGKDIVYPYMGHVRSKHVEKTIVLEDDILYTCFFFLSRAEELIVPDRDKHGRFAAKYSILGQHNNLQIPLLDEYSRSVMKLLDLDLPSAGFGHVYLTHDIDVLACFRNMRGFIGGWLREGMDAVLDAAEDIRKDPAYTFPWLVKQDNKVPGAEVIYFVKDTLGKGYDYPQYNLHGKDWTRLQKYLKSKKVQFGLHSSYYGDLPPKPATTLHRSHYLRCSINQMQRLCDAGITDDFTMGFADAAGFRLQTSRAVRWINPVTMQLTGLTLHPLIVMDGTLSQANYMGLNEDEAYYYCVQIFGKVRQHHGDLCILWHNIDLDGTPWHKSLYEQLIQLIVEN